MKFKIYSSSAGSGKTYTLTKEYLKLALQTDNPFYFRHILAITFTNDAANEMKARILKALKEFAYPELLNAKELKKSNELLDTLVSELGQTPEILKLRAEKVFIKIIYNYSDFAVSTIDSFVNNIINAFTQELDIPYNYELDLDTATLMKTTIDRVVDKVGLPGKEDFSKMMVKWAIDKVDEGKSWGRIAIELFEFARQDLLNERAYQYVKKLKNLSIADFDVIDDQIKGYLNGIEQSVQSTAQKALSLINDAHIDLNHFYQGRNGVGVFIQKVAAGEKVLDKPNSYVGKAIEEDIWYSGKKANPAIDAIKDQLKEYLLEIEALRENSTSDYTLAKLVQRHLYKLALIQEIEQELQVVKRENNSIHISDTNKKIAEIISSEPVPFIYERVGEKYHHILIDEFQDTSVLQWLNLLPLVENSLAEGNFNLIVGDAKQAIYRWRGGEMEQLVNLYKKDIPKLLDFDKDGFPFLEERYELITRHHQPAQLNSNFRSTKEVIAFNNDFFRRIVDNTKNKFPLLERIYDADFEQKIPDANNRTGGHIEIVLLDKKQGDYREDTKQEILKAITEALKDGFDLKDIAILCRNNKDGKEIANFLEENGFPIVSQDSLLVARDEKVCFLMAMLKVINHPDDSLIKSEALYLFFKVVKGETPSEDTNQMIKEVVLKPITAFFEAIFQQGYVCNYESLQRLSLYELIENLIGTFELLLKHHNLEYIFRFLDLALEFGLNKNTSLNEYIAYWNDKKETLCVSKPSANAITTTSIHKSKGLEYHVVILPFADWNWSRSEKMWVDMDVERMPFLQNNLNQSGLEAAVVQSSRILEETVLKEQYQKEQEKKFIENLNLLYVAFTRAIDRLHIIGKFMVPNDTGISEIIAKYLAYIGRLDPKISHYVLTQGKPKEKKQTEEEEQAYFYLSELKAK